MIRLNVNVSNPGQFFACCGLLELADRLWPGAEGHFEEDASWFCITGPNVSAADLLTDLTNCELRNTMTVEEWARLEALNAKKKSRSPAEEDEQKGLESRVREEPLVLGAPLCFRIDWWHDGRAGGSRFKTWAGQQSVLVIATNMKSLLTGLTDLVPDQWMTYGNRGAVPFYFDSNFGASSAVDLGFSPDPLKVGATVRPLLELAAFAGLQRFRPRPVDNNLYEYTAWTDSLPPELASVAAAGMLPAMRGRPYRFSLLFRTKYLKSFLPATPTGGPR